jgi:hypothetical protein
MHKKEGATLTNNEQEHPDIDIAFISTDEVLAWKRPIRLRFKSNETQVSLYWDEQDGYSAIVKKFFEGWSEDEQVEFEEWLREQDNLETLDDLTAWTPREEEERNHSFEDGIKQKSRLQVLMLNWQGRPKAQVQLLTHDQEQSTAAISLGDYSLATIGQMMSLLLLGYQSAIESEIPTQVGYKELVDHIANTPDSGLEEFLDWLVSFRNFN